MGIIINKISNVSKAAFDKCYQVGKSACLYAKKLPQKVDEFVRSDSFNTIKGKVKEHNKALIGAGIILVATGLAVKSILSIKKELKKIKDK